MHWLKHSFALPSLPKGKRWFRVLDTALAESGEQMLEGQKNVSLKGRSIQVMAAKEVEEMPGRKRAQVLRAEKRKKTAVHEENGMGRKKEQTERKQHPEKERILLEGKKSDIGDVNRKESL